MYSPGERGSKDSIKYPKGIQFYKFKGWDHKMSVSLNQFNIIICEDELYLIEEEKQDKKDQDDVKFGDDDDGVQDPCNGKDIIVPNGLMRKAQIKNA